MYYLNFMPAFLCYRLLFFVASPVVSLTCTFWTLFSRIPAVEEPAWGGTNVQSRNKSLVHKNHSTNL